MTHISLLAVNDIYSCSNCCKIKHHPVKHHEFGNFCLQLKNFERQLNEAAEDDYWKTFLRPLRQYQFELCAAPLPFNHSTVCQPETLDVLEKHLSRCERLYPNFTITARALLAYVTVLSQSYENPLLDFIAEIYSTCWGENVALLVKESKLISAVEKMLATNPRLRGIELLVPSQLRGGTCYERLIVIGPTRWFPDYIFSASRATEIEILHYSWIRDKWQPEPVFLGSNNVQTLAPQTVQFAMPEKVNSNDNATVGNYLEPEELLLPPINWSQIVKDFARSSLDSLDQEDEDLESRLFLLEGRAAAFLDAKAKQIVIDLKGNDEIDLEEDNQSQVEKIPVTDIEPGMFILLRTSGGGDYIIALANRRLGEKAQRTRALQSEWKALLRQKVKSSGIQTVIKYLLKLGSLHANELNVRNWMSERHIRPDNDQDFDAILNFVGLGDRLKQFYEAASLINSAHRSAGKHIRKLLLQRVCQSDLQQLERLGKMNFELSEVDGGSMTAFRIVDISTKTVMVSTSKIAHPFQLESGFING